MRVVIYQGQYGIFKKNGLDLSMPAILLPAVILAMKLSIL